MVKDKISEILFAESSKHRFFRVDKRRGNPMFIELDENGYDPRMMKILGKVGLKRIAKIIPLSASEFASETGM